MNFRIFLIMAVFLSGSLILTSCNNEEEMPMDDEHMEGQMNDEHMEDGHMQDGDHIQGAAMLTQERLNDVKLEIFENVTGEQVPTASIAHGGEDLTADDTYRDVYLSRDVMNNNFQPGDIIVKRTYKKNDDGSKGELLVTFAMMKHDEGYNPDGGEWEWAKMPAKGTDLDMYPNGKLPAQDSKMRGKMQGCIDCHAKADGNDFVFSK